jgi:hypothetical protein
MASPTIPANRVGLPSSASGNRAKLGASMSDLFKKDVSDALSKGGSLDEIAAILRRHRDLGLTQQAAYDVLQELRDHADEQAEDALLEVMDIVSGYCQPRYRVWEVKE